MGAAGGLVGEWMLPWEAGTAVSAWTPGLMGNSGAEWCRQTWLQACTPMGSHSLSHIIRTACRAPTRLLLT